MPNRPSLTQPAEFTRLKKKKNKPPDSAKIHGNDITAGDTVTVKGTHGNSPTIWKGTIHRDKNPDGSYKTEDLKVESEEHNYEKEKDSDAAGTEDVSVTVTNPMTGTSNEVRTPNVPVIP